jgi:hypothetical protein
VGLEILFLLSVAIFLPFVSAGFALAFWLKRRHQGVVARAWASYAARRGLTYSATESAWPAVASAVVSGDEAAGPFRIELLGTHDATRTLLTLRREPPRLGEATLGAEGTVLHERPVGFGSALLDPAFLRSFRAFALDRRTVLRYARGAVELEWPGGELSAARLDEARRVASLAAFALTAQAARAGT